jgi:hypothetical protein
MDPNGLHIWPRQTFMMIALPNQVKGISKYTYNLIEEIYKQFLFSG